MVAAVCITDHWPLELTTQYLEVMSERNGHWTYFQTPRDQEWEIMPLYVLQVHIQIHF